MSLTPAGLRRALSTALDDAAMDEFAAAYRNGELPSELAALVQARGRAGVDQSARLMVHPSTTGLVVEQVDLGRRHLVEWDAAVKALINDMRERSPDRVSSGASRDDTDRARHVDPEHQRDRVRFVPASDIGRAGVFVVVDDSMVLTLRESADVASVDVTVHQGDGFRSVVEVGSAPGDAPFGDGPVHFGHRVGLERVRTAGRLASYRVQIDGFDVARLALATDRPGAQEVTVFDQHPGRPFIAYEHRRGEGSAGDGVQGDTRQAVERLNAWAAPSPGGPSGPSPGCGV